jgi:PleD family two-component response regulator
VVEAAKTLKVAKGKPIEVLVVDDDMRLQRLMHRILELEGYRVLTAGDGEAALKEFCLLITMVEIGGFEPPTSAMRTQRSPS